MSFLITIKIVDHPYHLNFHETGAISQPAFELGFSDLHNFEIALTHNYAPEAAQVGACV